MTPAAPLTPAPIVVVGMHRSGTSFLVRTLNLAGLWLGAESNLVSVQGRAAPGNPKGNYESLAAVAINDELLQRSGGAWFNPPATLAPQAHDVQRMQALCAQLERERPAGCPRWGWKDPRTVLTLDAWAHALQRDVYLVASIRHPMAVANSLQARDGLPTELGLALWGIYNAALLRHLERHPHLLVRFDVEPGALVRQVTAVCRHTGLRVDAATTLSWYEPALVRSVADGGEAALPQAVSRLWQQLLELHAAQGL